jgi:hypothetical protein
MYFGSYPPPSCSRPPPRSQGPPSSVAVLLAGVLLHRRRGQVRKTPRFGLLCDVGPLPPLGDLDPSPRRCRACFLLSFFVRREEPPPLFFSFFFSSALHHDPPLLFFLVPPNLSPASRSHPVHQTPALRVRVCACVRACVCACVCVRARGRKKTTRLGTSSSRRTPPACARAR